MKSISCSDMGVSCPFVAHDETAEGAVMKLQAHAGEAHMDEIKKMSETMTPEEMKMAMLAKVKDEPMSTETPAAGAM